jgi:hypothetical protein
MTNDVQELSGPFKKVTKALAIATLAFGMAGAANAAQGDVACCSGCCHHAGNCYMIPAPVQPVHKCVKVAPCDTSVMHLK